MNVDNFIQNSAYQTGQVTRRESNKVCILIVAVVKMCSGLLRVLSLALAIEQLFVCSVQPDFDSYVPDVHSAVKKDLFAASHGNVSDESHQHQRFMFWWIPISAAQRFRKLESILSKPYCVLYYPIEDGVYPAGNLDVTWRSNLNMIGNEVRITHNDFEFHRTVLESELQQTSVTLEPGSHVISVALLDRACVLQARDDCDILELSVAFTVVEPSFAWQEHDQPYVVTGRGALLRAANPPARPAHAQ